MSAKTEAKSKDITGTGVWLLIARDGETTDGRHVAAQVLNDMANTFDPKIFAAQMVLPPLPGSHPAAPINALKIEVEDCETLLYAHTDEFPFMAHPYIGRELYPCIEVAMQFSETGKAYLTGIRLSDTPAIKNIPSINHLFK